MMTRCKPSATRNFFLLVVIFHQNKVDYMSTCDLHKYRGCLTTVGHWSGQVRWQRQGRGLVTQFVLGSGLSRGHSAVPFLG